MTQLKLNLAAVDSLHAALVAARAHIMRQTPGQAAFEGLDVQMDAALALADPQQLKGLRALVGMWQPPLSLWPAGLAAHEGYRNLESAMRAYPAIPISAWCWRPPGSIRWVPSYLDA